MSKSVEWLFDFVVSSKESREPVTEEKVAELMKIVFAFAESNDLEIMGDYSPLIETVE